MGLSPYSVSNPLLVVTLNAPLHLKHLSLQTAKVVTDRGAFLSQRPIVLSPAPRAMKSISMNGKNCNSSHRFHPSDELCLEATVDFVQTTMFKLAL